MHPVKFQVVFRYPISSVSVQNFGSLLSGLKKGGQAQALQKQGCEMGLMVKREYIKEIENLPQFDDAATGAKPITIGHLHTDDFFRQISTGLLRHELPLLCSLTWLDTPEPRARITIGPSAWLEICFAPLIYEFYVESEHGVLRVLQSEHTELALEFALNFAVMADADADADAEDADAFARYNKLDRLRRGSRAAD